MKQFFLCLIAMAAMLLTSCSSNPASSADTPEEKAVSYVKKQLKRNGKLIDYQVVREQLPAEMMADAFKAYRDAVFKAQLDYRACQTRGLKAGMEKAVATIAECQAGIKSKVEQLEKAQADDEHIFVLATIEEKGRTGKIHSGLIVVFNPETLDMEQWVPITTPVQNNAILLTSVANGAIPDNGMNANQNLDSLASVATNPVVKFILQSSAK